jgi:transcriptional regulator with XRE-family HTH domain
MPRRDSPSALSLSIGRRLRRFRQERGLSLESLGAAGEGGSKGHLSDLENGRVHPTIQSLEQLAIRLGVQLVDLVVDPQRDLRGALIEASRGLPPAALSALVATARRFGAAADRALADAGVPVPLPFDELREADTDGTSGAVPLLPLDMAAHGVAPNARPEGVRWVVPHTTRALGPGHFVARVTGRSMEPLVPSGSYALFETPVSSDLHGRVLLIRRAGVVDDDTGASFTLKRFEGERDAQGAWRSVRLVPANPEYRDVTLDPGRGDGFEAVAELVEVLGRGS